MKLRTVHIICLFSFVFLLACNTKQKEKKEQFITCEINTEEADETKHKAVYKCGKNKFTVSFTGLHSNEQALFGKTSTKLSPKFMYGNNIIIDNLVEGEFIEASIWRKDESGLGQLVLDVIDNPFMISESKIYKKGDNGWEQLKVFFKVPGGVKKIKLYSYVGDANLAFFDGLKIKRYSKTYYPKTEFNSDLKLYFSPKNTQLFDNKREQSLSLGVNINDGEWMQGIMVSKNAMPIKARLKGDWLDHLSGGKWSFRIKVKDDYTYKRMKVFSIQHPKARFYLYEYLSHLMFKHENLLATRYGFTSGSLNGIPLGIYAYEEHFAKQLIEYNLRREGPIVKFDENQMWLTVAFKKLNPVNSWSNIHLPSFDASRILPFGNIEDSVALKQFQISQKLMHQYKYRIGNFSDCFDVEKFAQYWALVDFLQGHHGKAWHNQRFYYNPVICKLEPIGFDHFTDHFDSKKSTVLTYKFFQKSILDIPSHNMEDSPFGDSTFLTYYLEYLKKYASETFINDFYSVQKDSLIKYDSILQKEFPAYAFDFGYLNRRAKNVRAQIPELEAYLKSKEFKNYELKNKDLKYKPINIEEVIPSFLNAYYYEKSNGSKELLLENYNSVELELAGIAGKNKKVVYRFNEPVLLKNYYRKVHPIKLEVPSIEKAAFIAFKIKDSSDLLYTPITPWEKVTGLSPYQKIKADFDFNNSKLFKLSGDSVIFEAKKYEIRSKILIPSGKKVIIEAGAEIDITNKGSFISHAPIFSFGTKEKPVFIHSSDSSANGFVVLQAKGKSILNHTYFKHLNTLNYDGWTLTGAVNFYESDVALNSCQFISNHCEDALNIVRANFVVDKAEFYHIYADAFDSDFCTGELTNSIFKHVGNDAIDFSTSQITIRDCEISHISDKGISGGEESTLKVYNTTLSNCNIGAASKDLSVVDLINVSISDCNYGLVALRKKPEYGPASLNTSGLKIENCNTEELIELNSILNREGKQRKGHRKNVAAMFY